MDFSMPVLDGPTATKAIRNYLEQNGISREQQPFICCMSAYPEQSFQIAAINSGMDQYLTKPIFKDNLTKLMIKVSLIK